MTAPLALLKGKTLGQTIYNYIAAGVLLFVVALIAWGLISGKFWKWKAERAEDRADVAEANAAVAQGNAISANAGAENATITRGNMDAGSLNIRFITDQAATRAENHDDSNPVGDDGALPADLVRELDEADDRARAAANRLQRKNAR